jgi:hypothetical protein
MRLERQVGCILERRLSPSSLPQDWGRVRERGDAAEAFPIQRRVYLRGNQRK